MDNSKTLTRSSPRNQSPLATRLTPQSLTTSPTRVSRPTTSTSRGGDTLTRASISTRKKWQSRSQGTATCSVAKLYQISYLSSNLRFPLTSTMSCINSQRKTTLLLHQISTMPSLRSLVSKTCLEDLSKKLREFCILMVIPSKRYTF